MSHSQKDCKTHCNLRLVDEIEEIAHNDDDFTEANNVEDAAGMSKHSLKRHITPAISNNTQLI